MGAAAFRAIDTLGFGPIPFPLGESTVRQAISTSIAAGVIWVSERDEKGERVWQLNFPMRTDAEDALMSYFYRASSGGAGVFDFDVPNASPPETVKVWLGRDNARSFSRRYFAGGRSSYFVTLREVK